MQLIKENLPAMAVFALALVLLQACADKAEDASPVIAPENILLTSEFELTNWDALENPEFSAATDVHEMVAGGDPSVQDRGPCAKIHHKMQLHHRDSLHHPHHLGLVFHRMNIDTNQLRQIRGYLREYCNCTSTHLQRIRNVHKEIIAKGNAQRHELLVAFRSGRIDRTELMQRLHQLNHRVRQALISVPGKREAIQSVKRCRHQLFTDISSILNERQLHVWRRWVQSHK